MSLRLDLYVHLPDGSHDHRIDDILTIVKRIETKQEQIMATLDQVLADVTAETTSLDSVIALIQGLKQQLADALSGATLPPATQAKVDAIFAAAETNAAKVATALAANVPTP